MIASPSSIVTTKFSVSREQAEILSDPSPIKIAVCGRRWGKTTIEQIALAKAAIEKPGSINWFVSNGYAQAMAVMRNMKRSEGFMRFVKRAVSQFPPRFEMKNTSEICFRSLDRPDLLRGAGLNLLCPDELAFSDEEAFYKVLLPMVSDTNGQILAGSTYNGKNWFYDLAQDGILGRDDGIRTWVYPTSTGLAFQGEEGKAKLERLKRRFAPAIWAQEYECEPQIVANAVFNFIERAITDQLPPTAPVDGRKYIAGIDIGRTIDHTAIVVIDVQSGFVVYAFEVPLGIEHIEIAQICKRICEFWHAEPCIDSTHVQAANRERFVELYKDVLPNCHTVSQNRAVKVDMVNNLGFEIQKASIQIPKVFEDLIKQIYNYRYQNVAGSLLPIYTAPEGEHDDILSALYLACWARKRGWEPDDFKPKKPIPALGTIGHTFYQDRKRNLGSGGGKL